MGLISGLKNFIYAWDMFSTSATLRVRGSSDYQTLVGGFLSLALVIGLIGLFFSDLFSVATYTAITSASQEGQNLQDTDKLTGIMFAIGIKGINLTQSTNKILSLAVSSNTYENYSPRPSVQVLPLSACDQTFWNSLGENFKDAYTIFGMDTMLCPDSSVEFSVQGHQSLSLYKTLELRISKCTGSPNCASAPVINNWFTTQITSSDYIRTRFFLVDTVIKGNSAVPVSQSLRRNINFDFTPSSGYRGTIYLGKYSVTTDYSYWPWQDQDTTTGHYVQSYHSGNIQISSDVYVSLNIEKSTQEMVVSRNYGKIDQVLAYIGGLFGLVLPLFVFFMNSYSEYCYELYVAESTFKHDPKFRQSSFGFFSYVGYQLWQFLGNFCCQPNIKRFKTIQAAKQEANQQLDIRLIMRKLNYMNQVCNILLQDHQRMALYLAEYPTMEQHAKMRQCFDESRQLFEDFYESQSQTQHKYDCQKEMNKNEIFSGDRQLPVQNQLEASGMDFMKIFPLPLVKQNNKQQVKRQTIINDGQYNNQQNMQEGTRDALSFMVKQVLRDGEKDKINNKIMKKIPTNLKQKYILKML